MRKRILSILIGLILVIIGGVICYSALTQINFDFSALNVVQYQTESCEVSEEFQSIRIQGDALDVDFETSADGKCHLLFSDSVKGKHSAVVEEGTLVIQMTDDREWYEHFGVNVGGPKVTLFLPKAKYAGLSVDVSDGRIEIPAGVAFENMNIELGAGEVDCRAQAEQSVEIRMGAGDLSLSEMSASSVSLSTATASVNLKNVKIDGKLKIQVSTGDVSLQEVSCENLQYEGSLSEAWLERVIAKETIQIKNTSGDVTFHKCDATSLKVVTTSGDVEGTVLSEKTFHANSVSGSVKVPKSDSGGSFEITTVSGDVQMEIEHE